MGPPKKASWVGVIVVRPGIERGKGLEACGRARAPRRFSAEKDRSVEVEMGLGTSLVQRLGIL